MGDSGSGHRSSIAAAVATALIGVLTAAPMVFAEAPMAAPEAAQVTNAQSYDGFADYAAKGKKMDESDVGCFMTSCKEQTINCFTDGSCLKGVTCLGRCQGEQECATRCFAQYGSGKLDAWLSCTLEDHECVKIPKDLDFSAIDRDYPAKLEAFKASQLQGTWFKVLGLNSKYDTFDCQRNSFALRESGDAGELAVEFRLSKPGSEEFWQNRVKETLEVDEDSSPRTFHAQGKMFGLTFKENWYVTGRGGTPGSADEVVLIQYRGHTLQGSYDGGFIYAKSPTLSPQQRATVDKVASVAGIDPAKFLAIDNTCPEAGELPRAADTAGMSLPERIKYEAGFLFDLVEWVRPGTIHKYD